MLQHYLKKDRFEVVHLGEIDSNTIFKLLCIILLRHLNRQSRSSGAHDSIIMIAVHRLLIVITNAHFPQRLSSTGLNELLPVHEQYLVERLTQVLALV